MTSKIIQSWWYTPLLQPLIGIIKVETETGENKFYIGTGKGENQKADEEYIKQFGTPFYPRIFRETTDRLPLFIDMSNNAVYLKKIIRYLIELNKYPDINISHSTIPDVFGMQTKIRAELTFPTGSTITAERIGFFEEFQNEDLKNYIKKSLLKEIAYRYIKRAFEKREIGEVKVKANDFILNPACVVLKDEQVKECEDGR